MSVNLMYSLFITRRLNKPERPKRHTVTKGSKMSFYGNCGGWAWA